MLRLKISSIDSSDRPTIESEAEVPTQQIAATGLSYELIAFDAAGAERRDDPDGLMSAVILDRFRSRPVTDVFFFSHGWMGDLPAAVDQYDRWTGAMVGCAADLARMKEIRPGFLPLMIGLHWPSLPWGDDHFASSVVSFAPGAAAGAVTADALVGKAAARTVDTPKARAALRVIFDAADRDIAPAELPPEVSQAYETLNSELDLGAEGPDAAPGDDREAFDPDRAYRQAQGASVSFSNPISDGLLAPLRTLSFWKMKDRGRKVGEGNAGQLLRSLREAAASAGRDVKFHLMGHSFGCIVASGMVAGPTGLEGNIVDSLTLAEGALSLWSYCDDIPWAKGHPGYFRRVVENHVHGPIVTTRSEFDLAVGRWYPWAAGVARQVDFAPTVKLPKYGAVGAFGLQGPGLDLVDQDMLAPDGAYGFEAGKIYNLQSGNYIRKGGGFAGAHGDIDNPAVAHAIWQAAGAR